MALGRYLQDERKKRGLSLRDIEARIKQESGAAKISSGHLSLIENGKVAAPSPRTLHALAQAIGLDYLKLMVEARHLEPSILKDRLAAPSVAFKGAEKLTPQEKKSVESFINLINSQTRKRGKSNK